MTGAEMFSDGISIRIGVDAASGAAVGTTEGVGTAVPTLDGMTSAPAGRPPLDAISA